MTAFTRSARPDDAGQLADVHLRSWQETFAGVFPPSAWDVDARERRLVMWTALFTDLRPDGRLAVADAEGQPVGFALSGRSDERDAPVERQLAFIYLLRSAQGSGLGQALLDAVLTDEPVFLWHLERNPNPRTAAFYERNGFVADGSRRPSEFPDAGDEVRLVRPAGPLVT